MKSNYENKLVQNIKGGVINDDEDFDFIKEADETRDSAKT